MINDPSRSSKVVDCGTNRKRVWDMVAYSIATLILPGFRDRLIRAFVVRCKPLFSYPTNISVKISGCSIRSRSVMSRSAESAQCCSITVKLFSKNSNISDRDISTSWADGRTADVRKDRRLAVALKKRRKCTNETKRTSVQLNMRLKPRSHCGAVRKHL